MRRAAMLLAALACAVALASGCAASRATATVDPSAKLGALKSLHVVIRADRHPAFGGALAGGAR